MSTKNDNLKLSETEQFSDLQNRLDDDETVLAEIHVAIKELLTNSSATEGRIREVLQRRFEAGELRQESFELVQKMLDRISAEKNPAPAAAGAATLVINSPSAPGEMPYVDTEVIGDDMPVDVPQAAAPFTSTAVLGDDVAAESMMDSQLQIGTILRDRFLLKQQVVGGHTGVVYKALDQRLADAEDQNTFVAIKVLPNEVSRNDRALRSLQQEVAKGRCLTHQNIVRCIDLDREDEMHFIVMEWLDGKSLATILDESGSKKIDIETTMDIIKQLSDALEYAHKRGVVHGDVNPGNIKITREGEVKLFDFGIARVLQKEQDSQPDFDPRELGAKSPEYSSMQVLTGEDPVPADDVFSLGCLMYRLIAGYRVFGPRSAAEAASEGMEPQQPQGLSGPQWSALRKALAYSRVPRFSSPAEFIAAIGDLPKANTMELPQPPRPAEPVPPIQQAQPAPPPQPAPAVQQAPPQPAPPVQQAPPQPAPPVQQPQEANPVASFDPTQSLQPPMPAQPVQPPQPAQPSQPVGTVPPLQPPQTTKVSQRLNQTHPRMRRSQPVRQPQTVGHSQTVHPAQHAQVAHPAQQMIPDEPMAPRRFDIEKRRAPWLLILIGIILIGGGVVWTQPELLERGKQMLPPEMALKLDELLAVVLQEPAAEVVAETEPEVAVADEPEEAPVAAEPVTETPAADDVAMADAVAEDSVDEDPVLNEATAEIIAEPIETETPVEPEVDLTSLLPADLTVGLVANGQFVPEINLTLREDSGSASIDLVRMHNMRESVTVLLEEVGFSGNRSPWEDGQYEIANEGVATFAAGQSRARTNISMPSDTLRETDRDVTIKVREIDNAESELAIINLKLEDDDRRLFEATLPPNTIAFVTGQMLVNEADPAVQVDVVRFKPSNDVSEVSYVIRDVSATADEDYFPPGQKTIYFSPGQRSARILIPLVQDNAPESGEVFMLELQGGAPQTNAEINRRISILIQDDD
jgi:serine/threonine protein kinase